MKQPVCGLPADDPIQIEEQRNFPIAARMVRLSKCPPEEMDGDSKLIVEGEQNLFGGRSIDAPYLNYQQ